MNKDDLRLESNDFCNDVVSALAKSSVGGIAVLISRYFTDKSDEMDFSKEWGDANIKDGVGVEVYVGEHKIRNALELLEVREINLSEL